MITNKNIERLEPSQARLTVTVGKEGVKAEYDKLIAEYTKNVRIDGFRQGKVPASVLERKFGPELKMETMSRTLESAIEEALKGETLVPLAYAQPRLEGEPAFEIDGDFVFSIVYDVYPEVKAGDWKGIDIEIPQVTIAQADEDRELAEIRERNAIVVDKDSGGAAAKGDVATVDYVELDESGTGAKGGERQDFVFEIGTGHNLYKFDDDIVGMKSGETKTIEKTFPADFEYAELAGKRKVVSVKLTKLKVKKLPELDDELAQDVSEKYKTLADLKADIRKNLEKRLEERIRSLKEKAVVDALLGRSECVLPASMVDAELDMRRRNLMQRMGVEDDLKLTQILAMSGKTLDDLFADWRPDAERALKTRLVLEKLVEAGAYQASDDDIAKEYDRMAADTSMSVEDVKAEYLKRDMGEYLKDRIREDKLMEAIFAESRIKKGKKLPFMDLWKEND